MKVPKGRKQHVHVMAEADEIVRRLRETGVTVTGLMKEYRCGHRALVRSVLSRMTRAQYLALAARRLAAAGVENRFKPGHETWVAGMKGLRIAGSEKGWFKAGGIRGSAARKYRAIGTITVRVGKLRSHYKCSRRRESSRWIKVRDDGPRQRRYIPYARYLWEQAHGPVPGGWFVAHANHRSMDDRLENLVLMDCRGNARRLKTRPAVEARRIEALRRALAQRRREGGAARQWSKGQKRRSRVIWECVVCGAEAEALMVRCPKCGSEAIAQTRIRPMPDSMAPAELALQEAGARPLLDGQ